MDKRGMKPIFRFLTALVFLMPIVGSMGRPAGAAKEDCRLPAGLQCMWDQEDFQGNMKAVDLSGQCTNSSIRSAANNGKSGEYTLYLYEEANCAGDSAISKLNAGESVRSVTATSARFAPKDS
jgi:hypothetical protein